MSTDGQCDAERVTGGRCRGGALYDYTAPDGELYHLCAYHHTRLQLLGWPGLVEKRNRSGTRVIATTRVTLRHW